MIEFSCGVSTGDDGINAKPSQVEISTSEVKIERPTVSSVLSQFKSGIGLDIAKNHTGVCLWRDGRVETLGFNVAMDYDSSSYMAEAKMRLEFKEKIKDILKGYDWEVCVIEDVYGGINFDTTRKLLALNCVVDELMLEGEISIGNLYRFKEAEWMKDLRSIVQLGTKLNPKYECELILEYLGYDFVIENKNKRAGQKTEMFYEDKCDATGQLLGLAMHLNSEVRTVKQSSLRLSNLVVNFYEDCDDIYFIGDEVINTYGLTLIGDFNTRNIEENLVELLKKNNKQVVCIQVNTADLGTFGIKNGFTYFTQGYGFLVAYDKSLRKTCKE